jgi:hypothetical protein
MIPQKFSILRDVIFMGASEIEMSLRLYNCASGAAILTSQAGEFTPTLSLTPRARSV